MKLRSLIRRWPKLGHSVQAAALLSFMGSQALQAHYVPDAHSQPVWQSWEPKPENGPDFNDYDIDGLPTWFENWLGTDPILYDTDYDGINDGDEAFTTLTNPLLWDSNGNGLSDLADYYDAGTPETVSTTEVDRDADSDGDGLTAEFETTLSFTDPGLYDSDGNGRSDYDDFHYPITSPDSDGDGVSDAIEVTENTDPYAVDSDSDGLTDGEETHVYGTDPNNAYSLSSQFIDWYLVDHTDSDGGGVPDRIEQYQGMNPWDANDDTHGDLDGDGVTNAESYAQGIDLAANITDIYDRDGDGMTDVWEIAHGLNPDDASDATGDPDGDNESNLTEFQNGTDPNASSYYSTEGSGTPSTDSSNTDSTPTTSTSYLETTDSTGSGSEPEPMGGSIVDTIIEEVIRAIIDALTRDEDTDEFRRNPEVEDHEDRLPPETEEERRRRAEETDRQLEREEEERRRAEANRRAREERGLSGDQGGDSGSDYSTQQQDNPTGE